MKNEKIGQNIFSLYNIKNITIINLLKNFCIYAYYLLKKLSIFNNRLFKYIYIK